LGIMFALTPCLNRYNTNPISFFGSHGLRTKYSSFRFDKIGFQFSYQIHNVMNANIRHGHMMNGVHSHGFPSMTS
jgi:hypothetical protein